MAERPTTAIALPVTVAGAPRLVVVDSHASSPRTATLPNGVYRQFLAYTGGGTPGLNTGDEADPNEFGRHLQYLLNNGSPGVGLWTVAMGTDGRWAVTYSGTGTGAIYMDDTSSNPLSLTTSRIVRVMLGFTTNFSSAAGTVTAAHQPFGFCCAIGRDSDTGRASRPGKTVGTEMPDGSVYVWTDDQHRTARTFDLVFLPKNAAAKSQLAAAGTPLFPTSITVERAPSLTPTTSYTLPWSVYETVRTGGGKRLAYTTEFQAMVAGTTTEFVDGYFDLATLTAEAPNRPHGTFDSRWRWNAVTVLTRAAGSR